MGMIMMASLTLSSSSCLSTATKGASEWCRYPARSGNDGGDDEHDDGDDNGNELPLSLSPIQEKYMSRQTQ